VQPAEVAGTLGAEQKISKAAPFTTQRAEYSCFIRPAYMTATVPAISRSPHRRKRTGRPRIAGSAHSHAAGLPASTVRQPRECDIAVLWRNSLYDTFRHVDPR
jgi:hypothetical protein